MSRANSAVRFGFEDFELDLRSCELRKSGTRVKLQIQPFKVLALLVAHGGQMVTREEICRHVWGGETFVNYEQGLNYCVRQIRAALGEDAVKPRYIETYPRRGYRFLLPVVELLPAKAPSESEPEPSIAVLPFANLSTDKENEYFSDGLAEEIMNALTRVEGLKVIARSSAFSFHGRVEDVRKIGETLNASFILEGSVRSSGSRIRVSVQLINARDGYHLWSDRFDREMTDVFAVQDEISQAIVDTLKLKLTAPIQWAANLEAYHAYLKGRYYYFKYSTESLARSKELFERAIALDPAYAPAYAGLASYYFNRATAGFKPAREVIPLARAAAQRAVELDNNLQEAHATLGAVAVTFDRDWEAAARQFRLAMSNEPVLPWVRYRYAAYYLLPHGRGAEALMQLEQALETDPLSVVLRYGVAVALDFIGRREHALEEFRKALDMDKTFWLPWVGYGITCTNLGSIADALASLETAHRLAPWSPWVIGMLAGLCLRTGDSIRADGLLEELKTRVHPDLVWFGFVWFHSVCSEFDKAADSLEKAIEARDPSTFFVGWLPLFADFRHSRRWPELAKQLNLPASQQ